MKKKWLRKKENNVDFLCHELRKSIFNGDAQKSIEFVRRLVQLNADLNIEPRVEELEKKLRISPKQAATVPTIKVRVQLKTTTSDKVSNEIELMLELNACTTSVYELKVEVSKKLKNLPVEEQLVIVNDCATNDRDLISTYSGFRKRAAAAVAVAVAASNIGRLEETEEAEKYDVFVFQVGSNDNDSNEWLG